MGYDFKVAVLKADPIDLTIDLKLFSLRQT